MNNKGQVQIGAFILLFVGIIVALSLLTGGISSNVGLVTQTVTLSNSSYTAGAVGSSVNIPYQALSNVVITNASSGTLIPATNYTVTNYVVSNGALVTSITSKAGAIGFQGKGINVSGVAEPFGYDTSAGGRTMSSLVIIFAALAIAVFAISYVLKDKLADLIGM